MQHLLKFLDYIAVLRPLLLIPGWTMLLLGYYKGITHESSDQLSLMPIILRPNNEILITIFLYSLLMGAIYIINQIIDSHTDEVNGKLYLVAQGYINKNALRIQTGFLLLLSIVIAFIKFPLTYFFLILLSIILGVIYSVPPIRLKGRPFLDLFTHAFGFGFIAFAVGWKSNSELSIDLIYKSIPYAICVSAAFINTTIPDMKGDIQNGDTTIGVFLGIRRSCIASTLLVATVPLISYYLKDSIPLIASILSLPFYIYMTISNWHVKSPLSLRRVMPSDEEKLNITSIGLATKVSLLVLSLLIAFVIPFYFALLIPTILLMKLYYKLRFGIQYP